MNIRFIVFFCILCCFSLSLWGIQKGSTTAVSIEDWFEFPAADYDNEMVGFGWFKNGFGLEDYSTSCVFNSVYPVSGSIDMKGGTLDLQSDLILEDNLQLQGLGTIKGNSHRLQLPGSVSELPANLNILENVGLFLNSDVDLLNSVLMSGHVKIIGNGNVLDLEDGGQLIIGSNSTLELQNMRIEYVGNNNIRCIDDSGHLILDNVVWCQMNDVNFSHGDILFKNNVDFLGTVTFIYDTIMTCTIDDEAKWTIDGGMTFYLGSTAEGCDRIYFHDEESVLSLGECRMIAAENGARLKRGRVEFNKNIIVDVLSSNTTNGIIIGDGVHPEEDAELVLGPGCSAVFRQGAIVYNNVAPGKFYSLSPSSSFTRTIDSRFHLATSCIFPACNLIFQFDGVHVPVTTVDPGAQVYYNYTNVIMPGYGQGIFKGRRGPGYVILLDNNDSVYLSNGNFAGAMGVVGTHNILSGTGGVIGDIMFTDRNSQLICGLAGQIMGKIYLNGGTMMCATNLSFTKSDTFGTGGTVIIGNHTVDFNFSDSETLTTPAFTSSIALSSDNGFINFMNQNVELKSTWTISGTLTINGNGNTLTLGDQGKIVVAPHSTLILKDCSIDIIDNGDIRCLDDSSKIKIKNCIWMQHSDVVMDKGSIEIENLVTMIGDGYTFTYSSDRPFYIDADSMLQLDRDFTFYFAPSSGATDLFRFNDYTSQLVLNFATFHVPITGLQLLGGSLTVRQNSTVYCDVGFDEYENLVNNGLTLGDGYDSENDVSVNFSGDKILTIASGSLNYKNVDSTSLSMCNQSAIYVMANAWLRVYQDMYLNNGGISFYRDSVLARALDKQIFGCVHSAGEFSTITI